MGDDVRDPSKLYATSKLRRVTRLDAGDVMLSERGGKRGGTGGAALSRTHLPVRSQMASGVALPLTSRRHPVSLRSDDRGVELRERLATDRVSHSDRKSSFSGHSLAAMTPAQSASDVTTAWPMNVVKQ